MPTALTHALRVIQLLLLCTVLTFASAPARASVMVDPIVAVDEQSAEQSDARKDEARAFPQTFVELQLRRQGSQPLLSTSRILRPGSPLFLLHCRILR